MIRTPAFFTKSNAKFHPTGSRTVSMAEFEKAKTEDNGLPKDVVDAAKSVENVEELMRGLVNSKDFGVKRTQNKDGSARVVENYTGGIRAGFSSGSAHSYDRQAILDVDPQGQPTSMIKTENTSMSGDFYHHTFSHHTDYERGDGFEQFDTWSTGKKSARSVLLNNSTQTVTILDYIMTR